MTVRPMTLNDVEKVARLGQMMPESSLTANDLFWQEKELRAWVEGGRDTLLVAEADGTIIGFLLSFFHEPTKRAELENLFVAPEHRKQGVGRVLMETFIDTVKKRGAHDLYFVVRRNNENAVRFYRKFFIEGFEFVGFGTEF